MGQEDSSSRISSIKPVEQLAENTRVDVRSRGNAHNELGGQHDASQITDASAEKQNTSLSPGEQEPASARGSDQATVSQEGRDKLDRENEKLREEQKIIQQLSARDTEVRAHEQAHAAIGGQYAGAPSFTFQRGPDGVNYAVGGEVSISVGRASTPQETIQKAQVIKRAALAPADPSPQDRRVAAEASQLEINARKELAAENTHKAEEQQKTREQSSDEQEKTSVEEKSSPNGLSLDAEAPEKTSQQIKSGSAGAESTGLSSADSNRTSQQNYTANRLNQSLVSSANDSNRLGSLLNALA
ncbi:MAG: hypothetical protein ACI9Y1_001576 [Lentisphaeria bacterium]